MRGALAFWLELIVSPTLVIAKRSLTLSPQMQVAYHATGVTRLHRIGVFVGKECALTTTWRRRLQAYMYTCGESRLETE
jgi:hypothetical protein